MTWINRILFAHGLFWLVTGLWPIIDIKSFMWVTGPKTDIWLVKTVSALIVSVAVTLLLGAKSRGPKLAFMILGMAGCISLSTIDFVYTSRGVISNIYLLDAAAELALLLCYVVLLIRHKPAL